MVQLALNVHQLGNDRADENRVAIGHSQLVTLTRVRVTAETSSPG